MWNHWVVRATAPNEPFKDFESAQWLWMRLHKLIPEMISGVIMPNHLHLIIPKTNLNYYHKLGGLLGALTRIKNLPERYWQPIPKPAEIPDRTHLRRQVRYVALNPCRKKLCTDPLEWHWSTYREMMGATVIKREPVCRLPLLLGESEKNFKVRFHAYVSADPSVSVIGTPFVTPAVSKIWARESILDILDASAAALQVLPKNVRRRTPLRALFIHLAYRQGWRQTKLLAELCEADSTTILRILKSAAPAGIEAAELCLGDSRLRKFEYL